MIMMISLDEETCSFDELQQRLSEDAQALKMQITLQREEVFHFMYEI